MRSFSGLVTSLAQTVRARRAPRFSVLSYTTENIGDEIQSIAAARLLPRVDGYIDREKLDEVTTSSKLIMNGWFCHKPETWPPSPNIRPLLISMHFTNNPEPGSGVRANDVFAENSSVLDYLRRHGPLGARDSFTYEWLQARDIASYYSGCLSLTLDRPEGVRGEYLVLNDLPELVANQVKGISKRPIKTTTHLAQATQGIKERMQRAEELLALYANASCVITTRLHGALPCLAMGTPVLLIDASWDQSRFTALNELVQHCSPDDYLSGVFSYDVDAPPPNPNKHIIMREELKRRVGEFIA